MVQPQYQVGPHGRPFDVPYRVDDGVAAGPVGQYPVAAQYAVLFGAQPLDRSATDEIKEVRVEFDCETTQRVERGASMSSDGVRPRRRGEPEAALFPVGRDRGDLRKMFAAQRFQRNSAITGQRNRRDEAARPASPVVAQAATIVQTEARTAATPTAAPR